MRTRDLDSIEIANNVADRFEGIVPIVGGRVDIYAIVRATLDELAEANYIDLEKVNNENE